MDDIEFDFEMTASPEETYAKLKKDKSKRTVCRHWLKHECQRGDACTYLHAMDLDKMPDCDLGANCNRPDCIFKHPPKLNDKECLFYKQGFCPYGKRCKYRHVLYEDGFLPNRVDISSRRHESEIDPKDKTLINSGIRRSKCNSYEEKRRCVYGENCVYCHGIFDPRIAVLDRRSPHDMNMPDYPKDTYSYFYFCFPHINTLSEFIIRGEFAVPARCIDKVNDAFSRPQNHLYFFVSVLSSKIIYALCEMKERCTRDREMSHPFAVDWLKVIHMPFMIFDRLDRQVKLERLEDGTELDQDNGGELFEWVWRHPNTLLMPRQSMIVCPDPKEIIEDDRVTGYVISNDLEQSTSFIHGNSLIVAMKRQDYEDTIESETLRLRYCDIAFSEKIPIGCFILVNDGNSLYGLLQATSTSKCFVGKAVHDTTLAIELNVRVWHRFHSLPLRRVPIPLKQGTQRWINKRTMTVIMSEFLSDSGPVDYPKRMNVKSPYTKDIDIDIDDEVFQAGKRLREHPTFKRFTRTDGWCYLELIGKGSMGPEATLVRNNEGPLHLRFYCNDGLRFRIVMNQIWSMAKEIYAEYQEWKKTSH